MNRRIFTARLGAIALGIASIAAPTLASAQTSEVWPRRAVKFIVPFAPGAGADIGARLAADVLSRKWGQAVIVENRPGGDSLIAIRAVVNDNDDHQFLFSPAGNFTPHPYRHEKRGYDRQKDLLPIARFSNTILSVSISSSLGVTTLKEFVELARKRPKELNAVVVPGITEFVWDGFIKTEGLEIAKVPFTNLVQGAGEMATGRIQVTMSSLAIQQPVLQSAGARLVVVTSRERVPLIADIPTAREAGFPSLEVDGLVGLFGPRSVSPALRTRIGDDVKAIAADPAIAAKLVASGQVPNPGGAEEFAVAIMAQEKQIDEIAKLVGLTKKE
ncbi:MAG: tripartite tricarboxylate transporter substrate binding protein [Beijerinckiaceae bacterium]|nr:tripartite tricarboxylate transporter substrate binding protein [Beijerinckiaceae bacterium]